jgi:hypothetical protein
MDIPELSVLWIETHRFGNSTLGPEAISQASSVHFIARFFFSAIVWAVFNLVFQQVHLQMLRLPPRPSAWEFMFQTYVLRRNPAVVLHNLVKRYGPVMHIRAWSQDLIVLSSVAAVEEFYKLHDMEFGARPSSMGRLTLSNTLRSFCFPPVATYWKHLHLVLVSLTPLFSFCGKIMRFGDSRASVFQDMTTSEPFEDGSARGFEWALEALHCHPKVVQHLCEELERNLEPNQPVREPAIAKLPYLQAVVKELFRLHPPCAVSFPHESPDEYCRLFGFEVRPRTQVLVNIYAVQRDPVMWVNPDDFDPVRFVARPEIEIQGQHFQLVPFGGGRRQCPGTKLAFQHVQLGLARYYFQRLVDKTSETSL